ncbi:HD domain-containing protein 2 [Modicella reniformis]|uniref:5'-deoxynucleotidase n=1 Tax=Modicella reniformis TaxID=1440133 RepID=A0A9P6MIB9_9FUNG|nr:HD domain-containing protein 2 [Modicella reniformis]
METFFAEDVVGPPSLVVRLQYKGAVYDTSILVMPTTDNKELYQAAKRIANLTKDTAISLIRLDHLGELVTDPRILLDGELLEIMEGSTEDPESIADHMYRMGIMALLIDEDTAGVDKNRCIKMAIVHDLAESLVGDITPDDGVSLEDKYTQEKAQEISALWEEYEAAITSEALLVKDFDKFEMIMQAFEYEKSEDTVLEGFFAGTRGKFKHPMVTAWVNELDAERAQFREIKS